MCVCGTMYARQYQCSGGLLADGAAQAVQPGAGPLVRDVDPDIGQVDEAANYEDGGHHDLQEVEHEIPLQTMHDSELPAIVDARMTDLQWRDPALVHGEQPQAGRGH